MGGVEAPRLRLLSVVAVAAPVPAAIARAATAGPTACGSYCFCMLVHERQPERTNERQPKPSLPYLAST